MVTKEILERIYNQVKTPVKRGVIIKKDGVLYDSPVVFKHGGSFYMTCVEIDRNCSGGYKSKLFKSDNLIDFREVGYIFTDDNGWDSVQTGAYAELINPYFGQDNQIYSLNGKYLFAFLGGNKKGYETDPLSMGLGFCNEIENLSSYRKKKEPILSGKDKDARFGEQLTIYKANIFIDDKLTLGHKYVMVYNAKTENMKESIFLAVSDDGVSYSRYLNRAIISAYDCDSKFVINGDPQIVIIDGFYVMFYFYLENEKVYNTFAVSETLVDWTKWTGEPLMKSELEWENKFAHKQWFIKEGDTVYQYYCAVNDKNERFIALATSK